MSSDLTPSERRASAKASRRQQAALRDQLRAKPQPVVFLAPELPKSILRDLPDLGGNGSKRADQLPVGWVSVTYFPFASSDECAEYYGPIISENDLVLRVNVSGSPFSFPVSHLAHPIVRGINA